MGARYYNATEGRFISPDPFGHAASMDLYSFANGDPVNFVDPTGRAAMPTATTVNPIGKSPGADLTSQDQRYLNFISGQPVKEPNWWQSLLGIAPEVDTPHTNLAAQISAANNVYYGDPTANRGSVMSKPGDSTPGYNVATYDLGNPNQAFEVIYALAGPVSPQMPDATGNGNLKYTDSTTSPQSGVRAERSFYSYSQGNYHRPELGRRIDGNRSTGVGAGLAVASRALNVVDAALSGDRTAYVYEQTGLFAPNDIHMTVHVQDASGNVDVYGSPSDVSRMVNESLDAVGIDPLLKP